MQQMVGQESFKKYLKIDFVTCMFRAVRVEQKIRELQKGDEL